MADNTTLNQGVGGDVSAYEIILGPGETVTIAASSVASSTFNASILWKELF